MTANAVIKRNQKLRKKSKYIKGDLREKIWDKTHASTVKKSIDRKIKNLKSEDFALRGDINRLMIPSTVFVPTVDDCAKAYTRILYRYLD